MKKEFKKAGDSRYSYQNKLYKACFQYDITYGDFKDLPRRTAADKVLCDKAFNIGKNPRYDGYQRGLASMAYKFFEKKTAGVAVKNETLQNKQLAAELHKPIIRKFEKRKVHPSFIDNICGADLADMQWLSNFNKGIRFLLCVIDICSKYAWVIPFEKRKDIAITNAFQKILNASDPQPNKIYVDKGSEFYNRSMKSWLEGDGIEMYLTHNEGKSAVAERTLKNKIYKHMTSVLKNVCIDKLDDIVNKYNNTYHSTIKMKPVDVKSKHIY